MHRSCIHKPGQEQEAGAVCTGAGIGGGDICIQEQEAGAVYNNNKRQEQEGVAVLYRRRTTDGDRSCMYTEAGTGAVLYRSRDRVRKQKPCIKEPGQKQETGAAYRIWEESWR